MVVKLVKHHLKRFKTVGDPLKHVMFSKYVYIRYYKTVVHYQREKHVADLRWVPGFGMTDST